jgi:hypothetical protein
MEDTMETFKDASERVIERLCTEANATAVASGFTEATPAEDVALMHSELSELLEDIRDGKSLCEILYEQKVEMPQTAWDQIQNFLAGLGVSAPAKERFIIVLTTERAHTRPDGTVVLNKPVGAPSELADVLVRVFHFCGRHKVPLARAITEKMAYNATRGHRHGGKLL